MLSALIIHINQIKTMNMKTIYFSTKKLMILFLTGLVISCSKDDENNVDPEPITELDTFTEVIAQGEEFESFPQSRQSDTLTVATPVNEDVEVTKPDGSLITQRFVCTTKTVSVLDGSGQFQLFDTSADVIYPGSLLQGKTLNEATPAPIVVKRAGGTISYNLNDGNLQSSFTVDEVKKSTIQDAMNTIIASSGEVVPANFQLDIIQVESESQLALEMGVDVEVFFAKVSSDMSFSREKQFNRTLVKLNQSYFTMSFDLPTSIDEIFDESVTPEQLNTFVQSDNPATFISSVTFGRIFFMLVESTSSRQEMEASLSASFKGFGASADVKLDADSFKSLKDLKIKVIAYGGDAEGTFELAGESSVEDIADKLAKSTDIKSGLPLSYVVRSVERPDQIVGTTLATEFDVVDCELKGQLPNAGYRGLVDIFEDGIGAAANVKGSTIVVYNKAGNKYAFYNVGLGKVLGKFDLNDPKGPMGVTGLEEVGAIVNFEIGDLGIKNEILVFNGLGLEMQTFAYDEDLFDEDVLPDSPIGTYKEKVKVSDFFTSGSSNFPFASNGIRAAVRLPDNVAFPFRTLLFPHNENRYMQTERKDDNVAEITNYGVESNRNFAGTKGLMFDKVGAAARVNFGSGSEELLIINETGDQMFYWSGRAKGDNEVYSEINNDNINVEFSGIRVLN